MLLSHVIDRHQATELCTYELLQNNIVGMGTRDGVHSYTILKNNSDTKPKRIIDGIKNEKCALQIWEDVKAGLQK